MQHGLARVTVALALTIGMSVFLRGQAVKTGTGVVSVLPPCSGSSKGMVTSVGDAPAETWSNSIPSGGGTSYALVVCDGTAWRVVAASTLAPTVSAGTIAITSSTTGTHTFTTAYASAPACTVTEQGTAPGTLDAVEVTTTAGAVTVTQATSGTDTFFFVCAPFAN